MAWNSLKFYFNVDGKMVAKRSACRSPRQVLKRAGGFQASKEGDHVPVERYKLPGHVIPTMALFTFVLLIGLLGASMRFTPEVLRRRHVGNDDRLVEILIIRAGLYSLSAQSTNRSSS